MNVGLYFPFDLNLDRMSVNIGEYAKSLEKAHLNPVMIIPRTAITENKFKRIEIEIKPSDLINKHSIRIIVSLSWYLDDPFLNEFRGQGGKVIVLGDDDGMVDFVSFPRKTFFKFIDKQIGFVNKMKASKHWFEVFIKRICGKVTWIGGIENSDAFTLPNPVCCLNLKKSLKTIRYSNFSKIFNLYFPVNENFFQSPLNKKKNRIVTVSRFTKEDEAQKNSEMLENTINKFFKNKNNFEWVLIGNNARDRFSKLTKNNNQVITCDFINKKELSEILAETKIMVFTSRWEGSPVSGNEMLSSGGTIVGPSIPGIEGLIKEGKFGKMSKFYTSNSMLNAITDEIKNWESGVRNPTKIRDFWKARVSNEAVGMKIQQIILKCDVPP